MRKISLLLLLVLVFAGPAAAQMVGYSIDNHTGIVSTFSCDLIGDPECFRNRIELGTIDNLNPWVTTMAPTGELVVWDPMNHELVWVEVPSLDVQSRLVVDYGFPGGVVSGLAFDGDGALWLAAMGPELYTVDQATGTVTLMRDSGSEVELIAFVGDRLFATGPTYYYSVLLELDPVTGDERVVGSYYNFPTQLTACDGRLWSLANYSRPLLDPDTLLVLSSHDLETGNPGVAGVFQYSPESQDIWWTLALVDTPEQQPLLVPTATRGGLLTFIVLTCIGGWLLLRRRV